MLRVSRYLSVIGLCGCAAVGESGGSSNSSTTSSTTTSVNTGGSGGGSALTGSGVGGTATTTELGGGGSGGSGGTTEIPPDPPGPTRYPYGELHSAFTKTVIDRLQTVTSSSSKDFTVFAKVGDDNTVNSNFVACFAGTDIDWGTYSDLETSRAYFATTELSSSTSFDRTSLAADIGWKTADLLAEDPTPISQEISAIAPGFAVIMIGTYDLDTSLSTLDTNLISLVDAFLDQGTIPILSTIPPRTDSEEATAWVPTANAVIRAVAQYKQIPFVDAYSAIVPLESYGLGSDGVHLTTYNENGAHGCWFTDSALQESINQRNLLTMQALDRAKRFLIDNETQEVSPAALEGEGTWTSPWTIDSIPFVDARNTSEISTSEVDSYSCSSANEGGSEVVYEITLEQTTTLNIRIFDEDGVDVDIHWLNALDSETCSDRDDASLEITADAGTYYIVVDTYVSDETPQSGPYRMTITTVE